MNQNLFNRDLLCALSLLTRLTRPGRSHALADKVNRSALDNILIDLGRRALNTEQPAQPESALPNNIRGPSKSGFRHKPFLGVIKEWAVVDGRVTGWFAYQHGGPGAGDYQQDDMVATRKIVRIVEHEQYALLETENGVYTLVDKLGQSRRSDERNV